MYKQLECIFSTFSWTKQKAETFTGWFLVQIYLYTVHVQYVFMCISWFLWVQLQTFHKEIYTDENVHVHYAWEPLRQDYTHGKIEAYRRSGDWL